MTVSGVVVSDSSSPQVGVIVLAAGSSRRMNGVDKLFSLLSGKPLISYCLDGIHVSPRVDAVVLVLSATNIDQGSRLVEGNDWPKVKMVCLGGESRRESVSQGLNHLLDVEWIMVHDGARPFIDEDLIARGLEEAVSTGAAVAAVPVKDTIKSASADLIVNKTLPRDALWAVQTPQFFRRELLVKAHCRFSGDVSDDAALVEKMGGKVRIFVGSNENIKITTPGDLVVAEAILQARVSGGRSISQ